MVTLHTKTSNVTYMKTNTSTLNSTPIVLLRNSSAFGVPECPNVSYVIFTTLHGHCLTLIDFTLNLILIVIGLVIIYLNSIVLKTLYSKSFLPHHSPYTNNNTYLFITHLAIADLITGVMLLYDITYNILQYKCIFECVVRMGIFAAVNTASVMILACMTVDRFMYMTKPYLHPIVMTPKRIKHILALVWMVSLTIGILPLFGWYQHDLRYVCNFFAIMSPSYLSLTLVMFSIPFVVMVLLYGILIRLSLRLSSRLDIGNAHMWNMRWRSTKTVSIIVGAYFICWWPVGMFTLMVIVDVTPLDLPINSIFTYLLGIGLTNSFLNPIIYAAKIQPIRRALCWCRSRDRTGVGDQNANGRGGISVVTSGVCQSHVTTVTSHQSSRVTSGYWSSVSTSHMGESVESKVNGEYRVDDVIV